MWINRSINFNQDSLTKKKRLFFGLCRELGYDTEKEKEKAKKRFKLKSFSEIKEYQINQLIDILNEEKYSI